MNSCLGVITVLSILLASPGNQSSEQTGNYPVEGSADSEQLRLTGNVAVYNDRGADPSSVTALMNLASWLGNDVSTIDRSGILSGSLADTDILILPGGWAGYYTYDLQGTGVSQIRDFIRAGGGYVGVCAGAFFACDSIVWEGTTYDYPLDLYPGKGIGPISSIAPWPSYAMCSISVVESPQIFRNRLHDEVVLYWGGPFFEESSPGASIVLFLYDENNKPSALTFSFGEGRVFLTGVHMEFEEDSDRDGLSWDNFMDDQGSEWDTLRLLFVYLLNPNHEF